MKSNNNIQTKEEQIKIERIKRIMEYTHDEMNIFPYQSAIENDKRSYCVYYISLLKTKHSLFFSFYYNNDYNSKIIKIDLFFISFSLLYTVNALFFDDKTMNKIYKSKGKFDLEYQLPKIIYSFLITSLLNTFLKFLALSNDNILDLKQKKETKDINERGDSLKNKLRIKFILYFILSFIFLIFLWYYISMFGAIYRNTQLHLLKDTILSFVLSLIYPFGIYLLPGFFRISSLSENKQNRKCLYDFRKLLQMI